MRIGRTVIDTDNMSIEELRMFERAVHHIRRRREEAENFRTRMNNLIAEAKDNGFTFIDNSCGFVRESDDFRMFDEKE